MISPLFPKGSREEGTALVMALVILVILTLLGVTVMNNVSLEAKMAGNTQETNRALHVAESGLEHSYETKSAFNLRLGQSTTIPDITYSIGTAKVKVTYTKKGNKPKRARNVENTYSAAQYGSANFEQESTGIARAGARTTVRQGVSQITPKGELVE